MSRLHVILLAGGSGTRFWPRSRRSRPKQLLPLGGKETLLAATWRRVRKLAPVSRIWIVAPKELKRKILAQLPALDRRNVIVEPAGRDTAPAIGLACAMVSRRDPKAVAGIFPTDHVIRKTDRFVSAVGVAAREAESGSLVCLGIRPDRPATGFGYLQCNENPGTKRAVKVNRFVEKPDSARARRFLRSGKYLWNGGMFVWRCDAFLEELRRTSPRIVAAVNGHLAGRKGSWNRATRVSVDYAVMEQANDVKVVAMDAGWDDLGSWDAVARLREERLGSKDAFLLDSEGTVAFPHGRFIAVVGVPNVAIVDAGDALLVASRGRTEEVKQVVEYLRKHRRKDLL